MCDSARRKGWRGASARAYEYSIHTASGARDKSCRGRGSLLATTERRGRTRYARLRCGCGHVRLCAAQGVAGGRPGARMNTVFIQPRARATKVAAGESRLGHPPFGGGALAMPGCDVVAAVCDSARREGWRGASARAYEYSIHTRLCGHSVFVAGVFRAFQSREAVRPVPARHVSEDCRAERGGPSGGGQLGRDTVRRHGGAGGGGGRVRPLRRARVAGAWRAV
jgi:hypothetical protein